MSSDREAKVCRLPHLRQCALLKNRYFSRFNFFLVIFMFCHIGVLLLSNFRSVCFIHMNIFVKCNKNEHL